MILDAQNLFSDAQTPTTGTSSGNGVVSTNVIDLGVERRFGTGQPVYCVVQLDVALSDTGSNSALTATLFSDTAAAMDDTPTSRQVIGTFSAAAAAGSRLVAIVAPEILNERYVALFYSTTNGDLGGGAITAYLTTNIQAYTSYADGITIS